MPILVAGAQGGNRLKSAFRHGLEHGFSCGVALSSRDRGHHRVPPDDRRGPQVAAEGPCGPSRDGAHRTGGIRQARAFPRGASEADAVRDSRAGACRPERDALRTDAVRFGRAHRPVNADLLGRELRPANDQRRVVAPAHVDVRPHGVSADGRRGRRARAAGNSDGAAGGAIDACVRFRRRRSSPASSTCPHAPMGTRPARPARSSASMVCCWPPSSAACVHAGR